MHNASLSCLVNHGDGDGNGDGDGDGDGDDGDGGAAADDDGYTEKDDPDADGRLLLGAVRLVWLGPAGDLCLSSTYLNP